MFFLKSVCGGLNLKEARVGKGARILLVDEHPSARHVVARLLAREGFGIVGEAENMAQALDILESSFPDLVLVDLSHRDATCLDLIRELRVRGRATLVYTMDEDADTIEKAFAAGANGYVSKGEEADLLIVAVSELLAGRRHVSPQAAQSLAHRVLSLPKANLESVLSEREHQVLTMLGQGESNADIAAAFAIGVRTVETYFARIIDKLNLNGMKELRRYAIRNKPQ